MIQSSELSTNPSINAQNMSIGYRHETVISGINLTLKGGEALALVGVNGSGKSTLLKTIVGLLPLLEGQLEVLGGHVGDSPQRVAYLSQFHSSAFILPLRAIDVVRMGRYPTRGLFGKLTQADHDLVHTSLMTMGILNLADKPLRALSGGQQQRVYLAQTLARQADLLVLDEPTAGLDAAGKEIYQQAIRTEIQRGASVVTATHDIQEAAECQLVMLLAHQIISLGSPAEALTPEALLQTFGVTILQKDECLRLAVLESDHDHCAEHSPHC